jgi:acylphosphatase
VGRVSEVSAGASRPGQDDGPVEGAVLIRIEGTVQGVGYRAFATDRARALGVSGWVCNLPDGAVLVAAAAPAAALATFLEELERGPAFASVGRVAVTGHTSVPARGRFDVVRGPPEGDR